MKGLKAVLGIALSVSGLGTAVALGTVSVAPTNDIAQVEAAGTTRLYLDMSGYTNWYSSSATFKVHTWNSAKNDQFFTATKVGNAYWYADVDLATYAGNGGGYRFTRYSADGNTEWNKGAWRSYSDGVATYYRPSGWTDGSWSTDDQKTWTLYGSASGSWTGGSDDISYNLEMRFNDEGLSFYNTNVSLPAGAEFKVKNATDNAHYGYNAIETGTGSVISTGDVSGSGSSNITVVNSGSYEVYMKPFAGKFWMQENSEATATAWATSFISATDSICSSGGTSANHLSALSGIWSDQKNSFDALTLGARNVLIAGTANATVEDAHDRYVHIMTRYSGELDAFNGWMDNASPSRNIISFNSDNAVIVIVVASLMAIFATGLFFFIRKRRYN